MQRFNYTQIWNLNQEINFNHIDCLNNKYTVYHLGVGNSGNRISFYTDMIAEELVYKIKKMKVFEKCCELLTSERL